MGSLALVSCVSDGSDSDPGADDDPGPLRAAVSAPEDPTTVILDAEPGEQAVAISGAVYDHAPVVVLAGDDDLAAQAGAGSMAVELGAPLLLAPSAEVTEHAVNDRRGTTEATEATSTHSTAVRGELQRLRPAAVVTVGDAASAWARERLGNVSVVPASMDGAEIALPNGGRTGERRVVEASDLLMAVASLDRAELATDSADVDAALPDTVPADPLDSLLVLVPDDQAHVAAVATARASGARVLVVDDADPRADRDTIAALVEQPPEHVIAVGSEFGPAPQLRQRLDVAETGVELPGGGQVVFPGRRFVALYGHPHTPAMGALGQQSLPETVARAQTQAAGYEQLVDEPVIPALEIIATVASTAPGDDGDYSAEATVEDLRPWIAAAGDASVYVVLDLQPGRSDFLSQAQRYEELLAEPHVGLALDPEWRLGPDQRHLEQIGTVTAAEVNSVIAWLAELTQERSLPQKLLVVHQFRTDMITARDQIDTGTDEVAVLIHADGFGTPDQKLKTWNVLHADAPADVWWGWKNFITEDSPTFNPAETVSLEPSPLFVSYQ